MRTARRSAALLAGLLCVLAGSAGASAPAKPPIPSQAELPPWLSGGGCDPVQVRARLSGASSTEVSRACGNISRPWAYRGRAGRRMTLRDFGRKRADEAWTRAVTALLLQDSTVDSTFKVPGVHSPCGATGGLPIYLLRFEGGDRPTFAVLRFDLGVALLFDAELPLGMITLGERADSLWAAVASVLDDDPLLRRARPVPEIPIATLQGDDVRVDQLPEVLEHVAPEYPEAAQRTNTDGTVYVSLRVGANGVVQDAIVLAGPAALRDASLEAVWQWKFKAALRGSQPTAVWLTVPVTFKLH